MSILYVQNLFVFDFSNKNLNNYFLKIFKFNNLFFHNFLRVSKRGKNERLNAPYKDNKQHRVKFPVELVLPIEFLKRNKNFSNVLKDSFGFSESSFLPHRASLTAGTSFFRVRFGILERFYECYALKGPPLAFPKREPRLWRILMRG